MISCIVCGCKSHMRVSVSHQPESPAQKVEGWQVFPPDLEHELYQSCSILPTDTECVFVLHRVPQIPLSYPVLSLVAR